MALNWSAEYACGCDEVDQQHQAIFAAMNRLEAHLDRRECDTPEVMAVLTQIVNDTVEHFAFEEDCMNRRGCSAARENAAAHAAFLGAIASFRERLGEEGPSEPLLRELHATAQAWLRSHICQVDVHLRECAGG